jgi:SsrA-binding protein
VSKKKSQPNPQLKPKPTKAKEKAAAAPTHKMIAENRKARHRYEILETLECGLVLRGSEVKSLRDGKCSLDEAYARLRDGEMWLVGCDIPEYKQATFWNHEPKRPRKLLIHARERKRFGGKATEKGLTLVPLQMYFNDRGKAKCVIGLCKGMKLHDKRETMKKNDARRDIERAIRRK